MNSVFGIHVGNTNTCLSVCSEGSVRVICNNSGDRMMPAMVTFLDEETVVGSACKSLLLSKWKSTVIGNKQVMERSTTDEGTGRKAEVVEKDGSIYYDIPLGEDKTMYKTPEEVLSCIYQTLCCLAKEAGHCEEVSCVLIVPEYLSEFAKANVQNAAEDAGWNVLQVISEPAAAVLGYNLLSEDALPPDQKILVYRAGGSSVDVTLIHLDQGMLTILGSEHSDQVGGNALVSAVTKYLADEFYRKYKLDPRENHRSWTKLTQAAENCIHVLSTIEAAKCFVESLCEGVDFDCNLSRARFESLLTPLLERFTKPLHTLLSGFQTSPDTLSSVLLCGGPMKIPSLKKYISNVFSESQSQIGVLPNGINYDEVLACGAARQAGYISSFKLVGRDLPTYLDIAVLEHPLTVEVEGGTILKESNVADPTTGEISNIQKEGGDLLKDCLVFEARQPLPIHKSLTVSSSSSEKVKLKFSQDINPSTKTKVEVEIEVLDDPAHLVLEIDKDYIKVNASSGMSGPYVVENPYASL